MFPRAFKPFAWSIQTTKASRSTSYVSPILTCDVSVESSSKSLLDLKSPLLWEALRFSWDASKTPLSAATDSSDGAAVTGRDPVGGKDTSQRPSGSAGIPSVMGDKGIKGMALIDSLDLDSVVRRRIRC